MNEGLDGLPTRLPLPHAQLGGALDRVLGGDGEGQARHCKSPTRNFEYVLITVKLATLKSLAPLARKRSAMRAKNAHNI